MQIRKRHWGICDGRDVWLFDLEGRDGMRASVSNFGGVLQSLHVRDARGNLLDVVLGYDTLEEYRADATFFGAMIGPIADRLDRGRCELGGVEVQLPLNAGPDSMHSGPNGFHGQVYDFELLEDGVRFVRSFAPGEIGFPGNLEVCLGYKLCASDTLRIEYAARCDCETAVSFTNHSYFNLDGGANHCREHVLTVHAGTYAETERMVEPICTGRALDVSGTPFDLRAGRRLGEVLAHEDFSEIASGSGIDHYFPVEGSGMRAHAEIESEKSGLKMRCASDAPGVLVYTGNGLEAEPGKGGAIYGRNWAICLETERFPNGVNFPDRRQGILLRPGERYESATEFQFLR